MHSDKIVDTESQLSIFKMRTLSANADGFGAHSAEHIRDSRSLTTAVRRVVFHIKTRIARLTAVGEESIGMRVDLRRDNLSGIVLCVQRGGKSAVDNR